MREWPAVRKRCRTLARVAEACTATMSARGTITSLTRNSRSDRTFLSRERSIGVNSPPGKFVSSASARSSRIDGPAFSRRPVSSRSIQLSCSPSRPCGAGLASSLELRSSLIVLLGSRSMNAKGRGPFAGASCTNNDLGAGRAHHHSLAQRRTGVRIGDAEPRQNADFETFHLLGLAVGLVIITEKMQHPMHDEMGEVVGQGLAFLFRLPPRGLEGDDDIADMGCRGQWLGGAGGEEQDVRRLVLAAPAGVEGAYGLVARKDDAHPGARRHRPPAGIERRLRRARDERIRAGQLVPALAL